MRLELITRVEVLMSMYLKLILRAQSKVHVFGEFLTRVLRMSMLLIRNV